MKKSLLKICSRTSIVCLETIAVVLGLTLLAFGVLVWRVSSGPLEIAFATEYIEDALNRAHPAYNVTINSISVQWPNLKGPLIFNMNDVVFLEGGNEVLSVDEAGVGLSMPALLIGRFQPLSVSVRGPVVRVIREIDNTVRLQFELEDDNAFFGPPKPPSMREEAQGPDFMNMIRALATDSSQTHEDIPAFLNSLRVVSIRDAAIMMIDYKLGLNWEIDPIDITFARIEGGLSVTTATDLPGAVDGQGLLDADIIYQAAQETFDIRLKVQDVDPRLIASKFEDAQELNRIDALLNGTLTARLGKEFMLEAATLDITAQAGYLAASEMYANPVPFRNFSFSGLYDRDPEIENKAEIRFEARDVPFALSAVATISEDTIQIPINVRIATLPQNMISPLWPDHLNEAAAEDWILRQASGGIYRDVKVLVPLTAARALDAEQQDWVWDVDPLAITGDFLFEDMVVDYRAPLTAITQASGTGRYESDILQVSVDAAMLGGLSMKSGLVTIESVAAVGGQASIVTELQGPMQSVLRYIQDEPIGVTAERVGLDQSLVRGDTTLNVSLFLPKLRGLAAEDVKVNVEGRATNLALPDLLSDMDLRDATMDLVIKDGIATATGEGLLNDRKTTFTWTQYLSMAEAPFGMKIDARLSLDQGMRRDLGINLDDWVKGAIPIHIVYTEAKNDTAEAVLTGDLKNAQLMVVPLGYIDPPQTSGTLKARLLFENGDISEIRNLSIDSQNVVVEQARFIFEARRGEAVLKRGFVPVFKLKENDLNIEFESPSDNVLKLSVGGTFLDARAFLKGDDNKEIGTSTEPDRTRIFTSVNVDRLRTHSSRLIEQARLYIDAAPDGSLNQFELDAVAGTGVVYLRYKPDESGKMTIRLEADDAGAMLKAFDMYDNMHGGKLVLYGESISMAQKDILRGKLEVTNLKIVNAPVLARLANAISLFGIQQLLGSDGISFSRGEGAFEWAVREAGDIYKIKDGRTSGASLGLTFDGVLNQETGMMDIRGTIVPVSMISEIVGSIPLLGDILTGGDGGGIIAATYTLKGESKNPQVSVNPLSALAPGILRRILFEN
jgi:hypothetical protein